MPSNQKQALIFAKLAYELPSDIEHGLSSMGCQLVRHLDDEETGTQGFIALQGERFIIAFRGTEITSLKDVHTDLQKTLVEHPWVPGKVHKGFAGAAKAMVPQIEEAILSQRNRKVLVTGHSLGAAIATLAAFILQDGLFYIEAVHTFGSPRVGDAAFAAAYDSDLKTRTFRHQNCCDIVTRVPSVLSGYRHVGQVRYYDAWGQQWDRTSWLERLIDQVVSRSVNWGKIPTDEIRHHLLKSYESVVNGTGDQ